MANGLTFPPGLLPALKPLKRPFPRIVTNASDMMLRAELPVQRNSTLNTLFVIARFLVLETEHFHKTPSSIFRLPQVAQQSAHSMAHRLV
jgi:hypothetical protein